MSGLHTLRKLHVELRADNALDQTSIGRLDQLQELTVQGPPGDLSWARGLVRLTTLRYRRADDGPFTIGAAAIGDIVTLEHFETDYTVEDIGVLATLSQLRVLSVGDGSRGASALSRIRALRRVRAMDCDLDLQGLRALLALPDLVNVEVSGALLPRGLDQVQGDIAAMRAYVSRLAAPAAPMEAE